MPSNNTCKVGRQCRHRDVEDQPPMNSWARRPAWANHRPRQTSFLAHWQKEHNLLRILECDGLRSMQQGRSHIGRPQRIVGDGVCDEFARVRQSQLLPPIASIREKKGKPKIASGAISPLQNLKTICWSRKSKTTWASWRNGTHPSGRCKRWTPSGPFGASVSVWACWWQTSNVMQRPRPQPRQTDTRRGQGLSNEVNWGGEVVLASVYAQLR